MSRLSQALVSSFVTDESYSPKTKELDKMINKAVLTLTIACSASLAIAGHHEKGEKETTTLLRGKSKPTVQPHPISWGISRQS